MITQRHIKDLKEIIPGGISEKVKLSEISRWKIGGIADCIARPRNTNEIAKLIKYLNHNDISYVVIGATSNLLFADEGLKAVCIQIGQRMSEYKITDNIVWAESGVWVPRLARNVAMAGLSGIEHTAGIPGTLGGLICMNGGSQRKGIGSHIISVKAVSPQGVIRVFNYDECEFEYRASIFQRNNYIITEARLLFDEEKEYSTIRNDMLDILKSRRAKFPHKYPNCGSTFISNPNIYRKYGPPGKIIEDLGYKGYRLGGIQVSKVHANFLNNMGDGKANEVLHLIHKIRDNVKKHTGFEMIAEVKYVNTKGKIQPAHYINSR